eukprot:821525_1
MASNSTWKGACDVFNRTEHPFECHCSQSESVADRYDKVHCVEIQQLSSERAYRYHMEARQPLYIIISNITAIFVIIERWIAVLYLSFHSQNPPRDQQWDGVNYWTNVDGSPIYYSKDIDLFLHFLFWVAFWLLLQSKVFKFFWMEMRYKYALYMARHCSNKPICSSHMTPFLSRFISVARNPMRIHFIQVITLIITISIQVIIRYLGIEFLVSRMIILMHCMYVLWIMYGVNEAEGGQDGCILKSDALRFNIITITSMCFWVIGSIVYSKARDNIPFVAVQSGAILLFTLWVCVCCYLETIWIMKKLDIKDIEEEKRSEICQQYAQVRLEDILQFYSGYAVMMRFLMRELSCENLMCYIELTQFVSRWQAVCGTDDSYDTDHGPPPYEYFEYLCFAESPLDFDDDLLHWEYIAQKYLYVSSRLHPNISEALENRGDNWTPGAPLDSVLHIANNIKGKIWVLLRDSFTRFKITPEFARMITALSLKQCEWLVAGYI